MNWKDGRFEPKQLRADATRQKILETALIVFSENGFHGTNTKKIAAAAGVATGTVYRYFKDKKTIFLSVCEMLESRMKTDIFATGTRMVDRFRNPRNGLAEFIRYAVDAHQTHRRFHREVLAMTVLDEDVAAMVKARENRVRGMLLTLFESMQDSIRVNDLKAAVELVHLVVEETAHRAVIFESPVGKDRLVEEVVDMVARYLFC
jgi:AcrR family transcriptional regulator